MGRRRRQSIKHQPEKREPEEIVIAKVLLRRYLQKGIKKKHVYEPKQPVNPAQAVLHGADWEKRKLKAKADAKQRELKQRLLGKALAVSVVQGKPSLVKAIEKSKNASESIRRLFEKIMHLNQAKIVHERLCKAGKINNVPLRHLTTAPTEGPLGKEHEVLMSEVMFAHELMNDGNANLSPEEAVKQAKRQDILLIFAYYASWGGNKDKCLRLPQFNEFLKDIKILESTPLREDKAAALFLGDVPLDSPDSKKVKMDAKAFGKLLELLAFHTWPENAKKDATINQNRLYESFIKPNGKRVRSDPVTLTLLFDDKVNKVLDEYRWPLWIVYKHFRSLLDEDSPAGDGEAARGFDDVDSEEDTIDWDEFAWLLTSFHIVGSSPSQLTWLQAKLIFNQANVGELGDDDVDTLSWKEFIECICRAALVMFPLDEEGDMSNFKSIAPTAGLKKSVHNVFTVSGSNASDLLGGRKKKKKELFSSPAQQRQRKVLRQLKEMKSKMGDRSSKRISLFVFSRKKKGQTQEEALADLDRILKINPNYFSLQEAEVIRSGVKMELQTAEERFGKEMKHLRAKGNIHTMKQKFFGKKIGRKKRFGMAEEDKHVPHDAYLDSLKAMYSKASADASVNETLLILQKAFHDGIILYGQKIHSDKAFFDAIDDDCDGKVNKDELVRAMHRLNIGLKDSAILTLVDNIYNSSDGIVEYNFFHDAVTPKEVHIGQHGTKGANLDLHSVMNPAKREEKEKLRKANTRARKSNNEILQLLKSAIIHKRSLFNKEINSIKDIFDAMDADGSEFVEGIEIEKAFQRLGFGLSDYAMQNFISHTDMDFDNRISFEEFEAVLKGTDDFTKLSKDQNKTLKSNRAHVYEAARLVGTYLDNETSMLIVVDEFEKLDHDCLGTLDTLNFVGALKNMCAIPHKDIEMIIKLVGEADEIDYIEFVHHLDNAMKQTVLDSRRMAVSEKLKKKKESKAAKVRNQWDLVYEPPNPQPLFTESLADSHKFTTAMRLAPPSNIRKPLKYRTDDRDWSKVAVTTRIDSLNTGEDLALDMSAVKFPRSEERFNPAPPTLKDKKGTEGGGAAQTRTLVDREGDSEKPSQLSPRQLKSMLYNYEGKNGNFSPYSKGSTHHPRPKAYAAVGVPIPEPLMSSSTHMKYDYTACLKVPTLNLTKIEGAQTQYSSPSSKSARNWDRTTLRQRMEGLRQGNSLPSESSKSARGRLTTHMSNTVSGVRNRATKQPKRPTGEEKRLRSVLQ